ncbi:bacterio-opsin activator domain-containing protein [Halosimplex salinum]|uniref:bacterio-opsin activator domain-containing protein n=1 Tax=Halosimplex salinum TaxID=1710538 RepID=UPI000F4ACAEE|nr:bacterio-opsin activator domain-containing protein [Halosimplex salinum]
MTLRPDTVDAFERLVERLPVAVLDPAGETRYVSPAAAAVAGVAPAAPLEDVGRLVAPADVPAFADAFASLVDGDGTEARVTVRPAGRSDGAAVAATLFDFTADPAVGGVVVLFTDETPAASVRRLVRAVTDPDEGVATADSPRDTVDRIVAAASGLPWLELGCYLRDEASAPLGPVGPSVAGDAEPVVRAADRTGERRVVGPDAVPLNALPDRPYAGGLAVPMGDHGVLVAGVRDRDDVTPDLLTGLSLVATTGSLALDRLAAGRALRRSREQHRRCRAETDRLAAATATERSAERRVLAAESTQAVREAVCTELAAAEPVALAWFGTVSPGASELVPAAVAGDGEAYPSGVTFDLGDESGPPAARVLSERTTVAERDLAAGSAPAAWRRAALDAGLRSALAVPIGGEEGTHGVLAVYGRAVGALDGPVRAVVEHLRRVVAYALTSVELRALALGNTTVELELSVPEPRTVLAELADATDATVNLESAAPNRSGYTRLFVSVDAPGDRVVAAATATDGVAEARHLTDRDDGALVEVIAEGETVPGTLASLGAGVVDAETTGDGVRAVVTVARSVDVREFVDAVRESHPETVLLARRVRETPVEADRHFRQRIESQLTDRQYEALQAAHYGGYFESPRRQTGSDIAATLGITQPTFANHVREAQRKLLTALFRSG